MCKQKPGSSSSAGEPSGSVDVPSTVVRPTPATQRGSPDLMPSVGACYKKMTAHPRSKGGAGNASDAVEHEADVTCTTTGATAACPWSPVVGPGVIPDPRCPRRSRDERLTPDLPCGSEESLLPPSVASGDDADAGSMLVSVANGRLTDVDLIRFSPSSGMCNNNDDDDEEEEDHLYLAESLLVVGPSTCLFSCDRDRFEDDASENEEFQDAVDHLNQLESLASTADTLHANAAPPPVSFNNRGGSSNNLSREASDLFLDVILPKKLGLPQVRSAAEISVASSTVSQKSLPICRICHLPATENDTLMSPCRCTGTVRFIHTSCLMKWLEISSTRSKRPPSCELCLYQYHRHKKFKINQWQFPQCSKQDKLLHVIFVVSLVVMLGCATATILCFKQDKGIRSSVEKSELTKSEVVTLVCGVFFFVAFFVAMYVEVKSRNTIYKLCVKFIYLNQQWYIDEYDKRKDVQPVTV